MSHFFIVSFYKFVEIKPIKDLKALQADLRKATVSEEILGTILLAEEGINGTLSGNESNIRRFLDYLNKDLLFSNLETKFSSSDTAPFQKLKILIKKEIVTLGIPDLKPEVHTGVFIPPEQWNEVISDPECLVIDTRNEYETALGSFKNAIDPKTDSFVEFPQFIQRQLAEQNTELQKTIYKKRKIAMFCTGGIRCEKASSYLLSLGFENVVQLQGGILKYLEKIPKEESLWEGECFIFDSRGVVDKESFSSEE